MFDRNTRPGALWVFDSKYGSVPTVDAATERKIGVICAVRKNRSHLPKHIFKSAAFKAWKKKAPRFAYRQWVCGELTLTVVKDSKLIFILDNCVRRGNVTPVKRREKKKNKKSKVVYGVIPTALSLYNKYMGTVDSANALRERYKIDHKTTRIHSRVCLTILEHYVFISTAVLFAESHGSQRVDPRALRKELISEWSKAYKELFPDRLVNRLQRRLTLRGIFDSVGTYYPELHAPIKWKNYIRCRYCKNFLCKRSVTQYHCSGCITNSQPVGLCTRVCFTRWHEELVKYNAFIINPDHDEDEEKANDC